jgi:hypothetical protein
VLLEWRLAAWAFKLGALELLLGVVEAALGDAVVDAGQEVGRRAEGFGPSMPWVAR